MINYEQIAVAKLICLILVLELSMTIVWMAVNTAAANPWVRSSCIHCHPNYGHGKFQNQYQADQFGNGYLLVIYHPTAGTTADGKPYAANSYISEVTGMPQTMVCGIPVTSDM